ncbi:MAG: hypothetical protein AB1657_00260 [Candidatus Micrarchaeota archaeon]
MRRIAFHNRELQPSDYEPLATPREQKLLEKLRSLGVDCFVEWRSPRGMRDFNPADYRALYRYCFPVRDEQSPWADMVRSIREMNLVDRSRTLWKKYGPLRYHDILALSGRRIVAFTSFATAAFGPYGFKDAIVYNIYTGTADREFMRTHYGRDEDFTGRGISRLFYLLRHGIAVEDGVRLGYIDPEAMPFSRVAGTILEAEFIGQADTPKGIRKTRNALLAHQRMGALVLMVDAGSGCWITPCLMPKLWVDSNPLLWHLLFRPLEQDESRAVRVSKIDSGLARCLVNAYVYNFAYQCEPDELVEYRAEVDRRLAAAKRFLLVPVQSLPTMAQLAHYDPMLKEQLERDFGPLDEHEKRMEAALR